MYTITFYSFKGGVGRTLALVNVAAELAKMGRKVLLVDFDLEAPGLETFERLAPPQRQSHPGMVEYVVEYLRTGESPEVTKYLYSAGTFGEKQGQIWVMPAGRRDKHYHGALARIDWIALYRDRDGFLLFEDTKQQWEEVLQPDYVLIDSRTGHTDIEGICTRQLPDAVVVLFFPNEQNLAGLKEVCKRIRSEAKQGLQKAINLYFVMSNVPDLDDEDEILHTRLEQFNQELQIPELTATIHRYESLHLLNQVVFALDRPRSRLTKEYRALTDALIIDNEADRDGTLLFLRKMIANAHSPDYWGGDSDQDERLILQVVKDYWHDPQVLVQAAHCLADRGMYEEALPPLNRALELNPDLHEVQSTHASFWKMAAERQSPGK